MITSANNAQVKKIIRLNTKAKARAEEGCFVAEGLKLFLETPAELRRGVYVSSSFLSEEGHRKLLEEKGVEAEEMTDSVFQRACDTKTPQGILTVAAMPQWSRENLLTGGGKKTEVNENGTGQAADDSKMNTDPFVLLLEDVQDPGNVGTIIRTAEGAGVTGIFMSDRTADQYQPKVVRSTMGSIYRVPVRRERDLAETARWLKKRNVTLCAAHLAGRHSFLDEDYCRPVGIMIGNEGRGLSEELSAEADVLVRIPMEGKVESLNAAVASALLMYAVHTARNKR